MTDMGPDAWLDGEAGPVVRPYAMISGRTRPTHAELDLISIVIATGSGTRAAERPGGELGPEAVRILRFCQDPMSVAEISAHLDLPAGTVKVLLSDLIDQNFIASRSPALDARPAHQILEAVMHGLQAL
ncbi:MAG: DUF742 domain-containing protein [Catenulispora sp.]|nr:DUF742 domain-containing protein [Catenulispora sp.]